MATQASIVIADRSISVEFSGHCQRRPLETNAAELDPTGLAETVLDAINPPSNGEIRATLYVPTSWCYVHRISVPQRRPTREMLAYALEEFIPVDIESLTCEFVRTAGGSHIGIALKTDHLKPLLKALAGGGVWIERIAIQALDAVGCGPQNGCLIWTDHDHVALLGRDGDAVNDLQVHRFATNSEADGRAESVLGRLDGAGDGKIVVAGHACDTQCALLAEVLKDRLDSEPPEDGPQRTTAAAFNLARDALAPPSRAIDLLRSWQRIAAAAVLCLFLLAIGLMIQRGRLQTRLDDIAGWERQVYGKVFPGQKVPAGVAMRLASQRKRLEGLTMAAEQTPNLTVDALETLRNVVACLPTDLRLDLQEIRIEGSDIVLRGRSREHRHAERLARGLDQLEDTECAAPRTDRSGDGGVQFYVHARRSPGGAE